MSDRSLLLHLLQHAEHDDEVITRIAEVVASTAGLVAAMAPQLAQVHAELEANRPMLERARRRFGGVAGAIGLPWGV